MYTSGVEGLSLGMGTGDRSTCDTGVIKLSAPTSCWPHNVCQVRRSNSHFKATMNGASCSLATFTMRRSLLSIEKLARELVFWNLQVQASSATHSIA